MECVKLHFTFCSPFLSSVAKKPWMCTARIQWAIRLYTVLPTGGTSSASSNCWKAVPARLSKTTKVHAWRSSRLIFSQSPPCSNECICRLPEQTALDLVRTHELKQILLDFRDKVREMNHLVSLGVLCDLIGTKNKCLPLVSCVICMVCCCSTKIWYRLLQVYMDVKACRKAILQL